MCLCLLDCDKVKKYFKEKGKFWGKWKDKSYIEELENGLFFKWLKKFDDYIEKLKLRWKKMINLKIYRVISEIISFRLREKRDEDLKKYIVSLESKFGFKDSFCYKFVEIYIECF